jgi:hypothetical protein
MLVENRLHKYIFKDSNLSIGMLKISDGSLNNNAQEVVELLNSTHFPGSIEVNPSENLTVLDHPQPLEADCQRVNDIVTEEKVRWVINWHLLNLLAWHFTGSPERAGRAYRSLGKDIPISPGLGIYS